MNDAPAKQNNPMAATKLKSTGPLTASANTINSSAEDMAHSLAELRERLRDYGLLSPARTAADAPMPRCYRRPTARCPSPSTNLITS